MEQGFDPNMFINTEYELENYEYKGIKQQCYCLKSGSTDYDLTGQIIWRAATQLAEYIIDNQDLFRDKVVLELGAGVGVSGLVCSQFAKKVYITDGNEIVSDLMDKNVQFAQNKNVEAELYLWGKEGDQKFLSTKKDLKIDCIIGADILYWQDSIEPLAETLETYLQLNSDIKIYVASRIRAKWVERQFENQLLKRNLVRIEQFAEGSNRFFLIRKFLDENEKQEKIKQLELQEQESKQQSEKSDQIYLEKHLKTQQK
ncbi:hypothetical protein PPERSA_05504 [Pseudocohnilembus persalinus]|uniref:Uncharacterized protein n=1 Tax=Pseudocohnilembus persalinus TaxID=266149 RepID=A0A0V0QCU5_PSEPJ|nr:hypothetical protein PPERSA_05504 [Pseudocohnilembus persalinus]|eukprot:KRX00002.1 hypothetical protein PPERSA_05504 [Pseudocohnilembus persalinus]